MPYIISATFRFVRSPQITVESEYSDLRGTLSRWGIRHQNTEVLRTPRTLPSMTKSAINQLGLNHAVLPYLMISPFQTNPLPAISRPHLLSPADSANHVHHHPAKSPALRRLRHRRRLALDRHQRPHLPVLERALRSRRHLASDGAVTRIYPEP